VTFAALAYGVSHGYKSPAQFGGSIALSFVFAIAYALTLSLWWLMLVHTAAGLFGAWSGYRLTRPEKAGGCEVAGR